MKKALFTLMLVAAASTVTAQNGVIMQKWGGATLASMQSLADNPDLLGQPTSTVTLTGTFQQMPRNQSGVFVARYFGYATAPASAYYTFWLEADQFAQAWWSLDPAFVAKYPLAKMTQAVPPTALNFLKYPEQVSQYIPLTAGQKIYIMAIQMETSTALPTVNHFAIGWGWKPNTASGTAYTAIERPIPQSRLMPWGYPVRTTLAANPMSVPLGQQIMLTWTGKNALSCSASSSPANSNWSGSLSTSGGSKTLTPTVAATYSVTCAGYGSSDASYVDVGVVFPVGVQLSASPQSLVIGQQATLAWSSQNASTCSASSIPFDPGWSGPVPLTGSALVVPVSDSTYSLYCSSGGNGNTASVSFTVSGIQDVVNPTTVMFDPSADHNTLLSDGRNVVERYDLEFYLPGATQPVTRYDIGKPAPLGDGKVSFDFSTLLIGFPIGTYEARVAAVGPLGRGLSTPSNPFTFTR